VAIPSLLELGRIRSALSHSRISPGSTRRAKTSRSATVTGTHLLLVGEALSERRGNCRTARSGQLSGEVPSSNPRAVTRLPRGRVFRRIPPARLLQHYTCRRMETPRSEKRRQQAAGRRQLAAKSKRQRRRGARAHGRWRRVGGDRERGRSGESATGSQRSASGRLGDRETGRKDSEQFAVGGRQNAGEAKRRLGDWGIRQMGDWQERVTAGELGSLGAGGQMAIGQLGNWESEEPQGSRGGEAQRPCGEEVTEQSTERAAGSERKTEGLTSQFGKRSDLS
jgi:hypothetical protein